MSDPVTPILGTIAAVTSLLKASRSICSWIKDYHDAPAFVAELQVYIEGFTFSVQRVQLAPSNPDIAGKIPPEQTNLLIGKAKETLQKLRVTLGNITQSSGP